jgi:hypothetical protein
VSDVWVKVPTPWADVPVDALIVDRRGRFWLVVAWNAADRDQGTVTARLLGSHETFQKTPKDGEQVDVLRPQLELLRDELGAEVTT